MQIKRLDHAQDIRAAFVQKFIMEWQEYQIVRKKFVNQWCINESNFDRMLMWDKMRPEYPTVSFRAALALLRSLPGEVLFLSEGPNYPHACELRLEGQKYPHFVAAADARELADLIEFEWMEDARLSMNMQYFANKVLPEDVYICTPDFAKLIVFTHEWECESEYAVEAAESRLCITFGFDESFIYLERK